VGSSSVRFQLLSRGIIVKRHVFAFAVALSMFAFGATADDMTGYISDNRCAQDTAKAESDGHKHCALECAQKGAALVFVSGGRIYKIDDQAKVRDYVGDKVTVSGQVESDTLKVDSVKKY